MSRLCLITNATSRAICWHITVYMNEKGISPERVAEVKNKLNFKNISASPFEVDDFIKSFEEKNIYFLELYNHLQKDNRYLNFLKRLKNNQRNYYFPRLNTFESISDHYRNCRIYHTSIFCKWITNDYIKNMTLYNNTGVYGDDFLKEKTLYYKIDEDYLKKLNLRECEICRNIDCNNSIKSLDIIEILSFINNSSKISISYEIIKENNFIFNLLINKNKSSLIEIFIHENDWKTMDISYLLKYNFILRLIHSEFKFFNSQSIIVLNNKMFFYDSGEIFVPDPKYIRTDVFYLLNFNTVVLSENAEFNSKYSYHVPVTYCYSSNDDEFGNQTIVQLELHGIKSFLTLKCHFDDVPDKILGYWKTKSDLISGVSEVMDFKHNYFDFVCTDESVTRYL